MAILFGLGGLRDLGISLRSKSIYLIFRPFGANSFYDLPRHHFHLACSLLSYCQICQIFYGCHHDSDSWHHHRYSTDSYQHAMGCQLSHLVLLSDHSILDSICRCWFYFSGCGHTYYVTSRCHWFD